MAWYAPILYKLQDSGLFSKVYLAGGKVRAEIDTSRFLDIHFDPKSGSYSYALIDLTIPSPGDKRLWGWDDFPHPGYPALQKLSSYPHHFQERTPEGEWRFTESSFRGHPEVDIDTILETLSRYLKK
jgi:hypothetical protein